jgi:hypothetical protein
MASAKLKPRLADPLVDQISMYESIIAFFVYFFVTIYMMKNVGRSLLNRSAFITIVLFNLCLLFNAVASMVPD